MPQYQRYSFLGMCIYLDSILTLACVFSLSMRAMYIPVETGKPAMLCVDLPDGSARLWVWITRPVISSSCKVYVAGKVLWQLSVRWRSVMLPEKESGVVVELISGFTERKSSVVVVWILSRYQRLPVVPAAEV